MTEDLGTFLNIRDHKHLVKIPNLYRFFSEFILLGMNGCYNKVMI